MPSSAVGLATTGPKSAVGEPETACPVELMGGDTTGVTGLTGFTEGAVILTPPAPPPIADAPKPEPITLPTLPGMADMLLGPVNILKLAADTAPRLIADGSLLSREAMSDAPKGMPNTEALVCAPEDVPSGT